MIQTIPAGSGLVADQAPTEAPDGSWTRVENMRFAEGYAEKASGHVEVFNDPSAAAYHVFNYRNGTGNYWIHSTLTATFSDDGTTKTDITGTAHTATADDRFVGTVLGGVYVQNNGKDEPEYWGGTSTLATLPGWNSDWRCKSIRAFKFYLIALNVTKAGTNFGSMVKWSHAAEPGNIPSSWDETDPTLDAGEFDLAETSDTIVDGLALGDTFVVYKDSSTYGLQFIGGNDIFRQFRIPGDHGMLARGCAAQTPLGHVVLTASDVVLHDGTAPRSIIDGVTRRWLFRRINSTYYTRSFVVHNPARQEVWICYPKQGVEACNEALIWNYKQNTFGVRELPNVTSGAWGKVDSSASDTWNADADPWNLDDTTWNQVSVSLADQRLVTASTASRLYLMDQGGTFSGSDISQRLERSGLAFGDALQMKLVRKVRPRIDAPAGAVISVQVGSAMKAEDAPIWQPAVNFRVGTDFEVNTFASGRYLAFRFTSTTASQWRMRSFDVDLVPMGAY